MQATRASIGIAGLLLLATLPPPAGAAVPTEPQSAAPDVGNHVGVVAGQTGWAVAGSREPDTIHDNPSFLWFDPPPPRSQRVYFNALAHFAGTGANPNNALTSSQIYPGGFQGWFAFYGVWEDCNDDGYIGMPDGSLIYPSIALLDDQHCPPEIGPEGMWPAGEHNYNGWVREFRFIGPADAVGDQDLDGDVEDDIARYAPGTYPASDVLVWGDYGLPGSPDEICPVVPPQGTTASTGAMIDYPDCHTNRRGVNYFNFLNGEVEDWIGPTGLEFEDEQNPQTSQSTLNQDLPYSLWGNPNNGEGQGYYTQGLLNDGGENPDPIFTTWDCSDTTTVDDDGLVNLPNAPVDALEGPIGIGPTSLTIWRDGGAPALDPTPNNRIITIGSLEPRIQQDLTGLINGRYSLYDALNQTNDGLTDNCETQDEELAPSAESGASHSHARRQSDVVFAFQGYQIGPLPALSNLGLNDPTPYDAGLSPLHVESLDVGWFGQPETITQPQLIRGDGQPSGAQYATFYAYADSAVGFRGFRLPGGLGAYGREACGENAAGQHGNWDCDPNAWYRDATGKDIAPRQFYGPQTPNNPHPTSPWHRTPRVIAAYPGQTYHLRDIDCFDGSLVEGQPAYASLQYFTDDKSCHDSPGEFDAYWGVVPELDEDFNGLGDTWQSKYKLTKEQAELALQGLGDVPLPPFDADGAGLLREFKWDTIPIILDHPNARDHDNDNWLDNDEILYWNAHDEPLVPIAGGLAFRDPDSFNDTDGDNQFNQHDQDSDGDTLHDGDEVKTHGTYPEYADSDCGAAAIGCTRVTDTKFGDPTRAGAPGTGDGINDAEEIDAWERLLGPQGHFRDCDEDDTPNILDADSDGDGILDGVEFEAQTDPCENPTPALIGAAAAADPSNENLPLLDQINKEYLEGERVDGTIEGEQVIDTDAVTALADYLLDEVLALTNDPEGTASSILPEPITRILDPILYDATSLVSTPPTPESLIETVTRPVWTVADALLATCGLNVINAASIDPAELTSLVGEATQCLTALVPSTSDAFPLLNDTTQALLSIPSTVLTTLPTEVNVESELVDQLLHDPLASVLEATEPVGSRIEGLKQPVIEMIPTSPSRVNLHPKNLADNLAPIYELLMTTGPNPYGVKEKGVSTIDSLFYNLYVADETGAREWVLLNVPLLNASTLDIDGDVATGLNGVDLLITASLTPAQGPQLPSLQASETAPTMRVKALSAVARATPLLVCAYHQLPDAPYIAYNCLDTRNATLEAVGAPTPSRGFPGSANVTLDAYAFDGATNDLQGALKLESESDGKSSFPVVALGSIFEVDLTNVTKPRVEGGDHVDVAIHAANADGSTQFDVRRLDDTTAGGSSEWSWTNTMTGRVTGSYHLALGSRTIDAASAATSPPASLDIKSARNAQDSTLTITTSALPAASVSGTSFALIDQQNGTREAFSLAASELPASFTLQADDATGKLTLSTEIGSPRDLRIVATNDRDTCPAATAGDQVTRQPVDADGGACLSVKLRTPLTALDATLASGGPSLTLASATAKKSSLSVIVRPGSASPRSLDAALSNVPTSLALASTLAAADGSTALSWSASAPVEDARILATSGATILVWNGTNVPTTAQASYAWTTDVVSIETSAPNDGTLEFLLTNTGSVPALPGADFLAGRHTPGKTPSIAAARISGLSQARAMLASESFHVETTGSTDRPFGIRYSRGSAPVFTLNVSALPADFDLRAVAQDGSTHRVEYTGAQGLATDWMGNFPGGAHVEGEVENAPGAFTLLATPATGTASLDASGPAGRVSVLRAAAAAAASTLAGDDVIHLQSAPATPDIYRVSLRDTSDLSFTKSAGTLSITRAGSIERGLRAQVGNDATFMLADFSVLPSSALVQYSRTGVEYSASAGTPPDLALSVAENGDTLNFTAKALPTEVTLAWTSTTQSAQMSATHSGGTAPLLSFEGDFAPVAGSIASEYVHIRLEDAPDLTLSFDAATDEISASASGTAGLIEYWHAANAETIDVPDEPYYVLMHRGTEGGAGAFEVFRLANVREVSLHLGNEAGQTNRLYLDAEANGDFYAQHETALGDSLRVRLSNIPSNVDFRYALGAAQGTSVNGMVINATSGGTTSVVSLHAEQAGLALTLTAEDVPTDWTGTWAPANIFDLRAEAPITIAGLAFHPADEEPPAVTGAASHLFIDGSDATNPRMGAAFPTGVRRAFSDSAQHEIQFAFGASPSTLRLIHREPETTISLDATTPAPSFRLRAPPIDVDPAALGGLQAKFQWDANGYSTGIDWGVDAPGVRWRWSADNAPRTAYAMLNTTLGTFTANAPIASNGAFRLQYTSDPDQPFYGDGPGLVIFANPTGPEMPAANVTTFTLDLPYLRSVEASYLGTSSSKSESGGSSVDIRRASGASPMPMATYVAAGAEALRFTTQDAASLLVTDWAISAMDGLVASVTTDAALANAAAAYRGSEGVVNATFGSITNYLDLRVRPKDTGEGLDPRVLLDYATAGPSPNVEIFADAAGALTNLTLTDAPSEFHVDAPLQGSTTGATGRAWTTTGASAGRAHLVLVPRDAATVAAIDEPRYFDAAFEPTAATLQLDLANLRSATWTSDPINGRLRVKLDTSASENEALRVLFRHNEDDLVLDATASATPAALDIDAQAGIEDARIAWQSATPGIDVHSVYLAPNSFVDAAFTGAAADWSLAADGLGETPLLYDASGNATSLVAKTSTTTFSASIDATDLPAALAWNVPVATCPAPSAASVATISTLGTGSVGMLRAATLPGGSGDAGVADEGERAAFTCDDNGPTTSIKLTGFESVTWERIAPAGGTTISLPLPALPALPIGTGSAVAPVGALFQLPRIPTPASALAAPMLGPAPLASTRVSPLALAQATYAPVAHAVPTQSSAASAQALPIAPLLGRTTLATDGGAPLSGVRQILDRDPLKADHTTDLRIVNELPTGETLVTSVTAPVNDLDVTRTRGTNLANMQATHDGTRPARVVSYYAWETGSDTVTFIDAPDTASVTLDATGEDFLFDYTASGGAGGLRVDSGAAGPAVYVNASDGIGARLSGTVGGPSGGDCSQRLYAHFRSNGAGRVGVLDARFGDEDVSPPVSRGAVFTCEGTTRTFAAKVPDVDRLELSGDACTTRLVLPATESEMPYRLQTTEFIVDVKLKTRSGASVVTIELADDKLTSDATGTSLIEKAVVDVQRLASTSPFGGVGCSSFGKGFIQRLVVEAADVGTHLQAVFGNDDAERMRVDVSGSGAAGLNIDATTYPTTNPPPLALRVDARMPITGDFGLRFQEVDSTPPRATNLDSQGHYAYIGDGAVMKGGNVRVIGFQRGSLVLDRYVEQNTMSAVFDLTLSGSHPFAFVMFDASNKVTEARAAALPATARGHFTMTSHELGPAVDVGFTASSTTPLDVRLFDPLGADIRVATPSLPTSVTLKLEAGRDEHDQTTVVLDEYSANAPLDLTFSHDHLVAGDPYQSELDLTIEGLSPGLSGSFNQITCGFWFDANSTAGVRRISVDYNSVQPAQSSSEPTYVSPSCPKSDASNAGGGSGSTSMNMQTNIYGIPPGNLRAVAQIGNAGHVEFGSGGPIEYVGVDVTTGKGHRFNATGVDLRLRAAEWDVDGDEDGKKWVFLDTSGDVGGLVIDFVGTNGALTLTPPRLLLDTRGSFSAAPFQIVWSFDSVPHYAGCLRLRDDMRVDLPGIASVLQLWFNAFEEYGCG